MKIQIISDIHLEWHKDKGVYFFSRLDPSDVDVLVVAGDLTAYPMIEETLEELCLMYKSVVYINGNHENYGTSISRLNKMMERVSGKISNLYWLENKKVNIGGTDFIGATGWFPYCLDVPLYKHLLNDYRAIKDFEPEVYDANNRTKDFLLKSVNKGDIVVLHHLPTYDCIVNRYIGQATNIFFVASFDEVIEKCEPSYIFCGHTHNKFDIMIKNTRVICNCLGYPSETKAMDEFDWKLVVEV